MSNSQRNVHTQPPGHVDQTEQATEHVLDKHSVKKFLKLLVEGKTKNDEVFTLSPKKDIVAIHRKPTTPDDHQTEFFCMQSPNNNCDELVEMIEKHAPASSMRRIVLLYQPVIPQIKDGQYTTQEIEHSQLHAQSYVSGNASFVKSVIIPYLPRLEHIVDFTLSDSDMAEFRKLTVESVRDKVINLYAKLEDTWESDYQSFELWFEGYTFALNGIGPQGPRPLFIFDYKRIFKIYLPPLTHISMVGVSGDWDTICQNLLLPSSATCVKLSLTVTFTKRDVRTRKALTPIHMEKLQHIHIYVCDPSKVPNFIQRLSAPKLESLHVLCEEAIKPFTWNLNAYYEFLSHCSRTLTDLMLYDRFGPSSFDERPKIPKKPAEDIERLLGVIPYVKTLTLPMTALIHGRTVERIKSKSYIWSLLPSVVSLQASFRNADDVREMVQSRNAADSSSQRTSIITSVMARIPRHKGQPRPKKGKEIQGCCEIKWLS